MVHRTYQRTAKRLQFFKLSRNNSDAASDRIKAINKPNLEFDVAMDCCNNGRIEAFYRMKTYRKFAENVLLWHKYFHSEQQNGAPNFSDIPDRMIWAMWELARKKGDVAG